MTENLSALLYLVACVCFIMALRGLSSPDTRAAAISTASVGMVIAIVTTLAAARRAELSLILAGIADGRHDRHHRRARIQMTALPQLVAAFHSLVGLAAVCVAAAAFFGPRPIGIGAPGAIHGGR